MKRKVQDSWFTNINLKVKEARVLYLVGTSSCFEVPPNRYKPGDCVRITVERMPIKKDSK